VPAVEERAPGFATSRSFSFLLAEPDAPGSFFKVSQMKTIENWAWAFNSKIRGQVNEESFLSLPVIRVDIEKSVVEVKGGEVFQLGARSADSFDSLEDVARVVNARFQGGVQ
jgi:hypothetical protein